MVTFRPIITGRRHVLPGALEHIQAAGAPSHIVHVLEALPDGSHVIGEVSYIGDDDGKTVGAHIVRHRETVAPLHTRVLSLA